MPAAAALRLRSAVASPVEWQPSHMGSFGAGFVLAPESDDSDLARLTHPL